MCVGGEGVLAEVGEGFCLSFLTQKPRLLVLYRHSMLAVALQRERENGESSTSGNFKNQKRCLASHHVKGMGKVPFCYEPGRAARNI